MGEALFKFTITYVKVTAPLFFFILFLKNKKHCQTLILFLRTIVEAVKCDVQHFYMLKIPVPKI